MISKHLCRLSRSFSSKKPYYSSIFKSNMIYFGVGALVFLGFRAFSKYKDPEASRVQRVKAIKENISKPKEFAGVKRDSDYEDIIKIGDQKMILIYGVPKSGMTTFLNEIETRVHPSTVLKIEIKEDLEETLNQFSFEHKLNAIEVLKFFKNVESAITEAKSEKTYVLIDGMEKLMPGVIDIFWKNFWKFVKIDGATVIVTFSDLKYLNNSYSCNSQFRWNS